MVTLIILISAAILVIDARVRTALAAYVIFTGATMWLAISPEVLSNRGHLVVLGALAFVKMVVGPVAILRLMRTNHLRNYLSPSVPAAARIAIVMAAVFAGHGVGQMTAFTGIPLANIVFYCVFSSMCIVILHRSLLSHVIGLLALGSAITLAGAVFAPTLPGGIEMADTFDAVLATFVAVSIARGLLRHAPDLDVRSLRELRG